MQDAAYMVTVPFFCPDTPPLKRNPIFLYSSDGFEKPYPFRPDIVIALDDETHERKLDAIHELESQLYEGGANGSEAMVKSVPPASDVAGRKAWLHRAGWGRMDNGNANRFREALVKQYGPEKGKAVKYAEAFEICEYGRRPSSEELPKLFPFD
jgi:hypothetical protein